MGVPAWQRGGRLWYSAGVARHCSIRSGEHVRARACRRRHRGTLASRCTVVLNRGQLGVHTRTPCNSAFILSSRTAVARRFELMTMMSLAPASTRPCGSRLCGRALAQHRRSRCVPARAVAPPKEAEMVRYSRPAVHKGQHSVAVSNPTCQFVSQLTSANGSPCQPNDVYLTGKFCHFTTRARKVGIGASECWSSAKP